MIHTGMEVPQHIMDAFVSDNPSDFDLGERIINYMLVFLVNPFPHACKTGLATLSCMRGEGIHIVSIVLFLAAPYHGTRLIISIEWLSFVSCLPLDGNN
jgi:hypothetical protein